MIAISKNRRVPPCAVKTCAVRPVFARVVGELRAADPSNVHGPVKQNASPEAQSEAPRRGPENQDDQHMLEQPRGSFPERSRLKSDFWHLVQDFSDFSRLSEHLRLEGLGISLETL